MATETSQQDVVDVLSTDHNEFIALITRIKSTTDHESQRKLADQLIAELITHAVAEEMWVYPAMEQHMPDGKAAAEHDREEHKEMEGLLKRMEDSDPSRPEFMTMVNELEEVLRDHIKDEEDEHFPQLRANVPQEDLVKMAGRVDTTKQIAPTRPHPNAPNTQLFHMTVGTGVGMVDRLRDKLFGRPLED